MDADSLTPLLVEYRYWIIIPLSFIEGPVIAFITGMLSSLGYFNPFIAFWIFIIKDLVVDGFLYLLGRYARETRFVRRWLEKGGMLTHGVERARHQWANHGWRMMFISKLPHGLSPAFLVTAGMVDFPLGRFINYAIQIAFLQYGVVFVLGYYFGQAVGASPWVTRLQIIITAIFVLGTLYYIVVSYLRKRFAPKTLQQ